MKIKVELTTVKQLNWLVAKCEGIYGGVPPIYIVDKDDNWFEPAINWAQGGPIIEREGVATTDQHGCKGMEKWMASLILPNDNGTTIMWGQAPLSAAMRCYVASKLGFEVEVPNEIV